MKAILIEKSGDESVLKLGDAPNPVPGPADLLIKVKFAALNRADLMQRQGFYPPPLGASPILGLECAGEVAAVGSEVTGWRVGDRAMALLPGGGYAELAAAHPVPGQAHGRAPAVGIMPRTLLFADRRPSGAWPGPLRAMSGTRAGPDTGPARSQTTRPLPYTGGRSRAVSRPGAPSTTAGMALTSRMAVAFSPAVLWSPSVPRSCRSRV